MRIIRVFPRRTSFTPTDDLVFIGDPPLLRPEADIVHVSVAFTWDIEDRIIHRGRNTWVQKGGKTLAQAWGQYYPVEIGGPAFGSPSTFFTPGRYVKQGVTFTSRGCPGRCGYCLVQEREGNLWEYPDFAVGHIIQDNNLLACSHEHQERVYAMLRQQSLAAVFSGGLSAHLVDDWVVSQFSTLRIAQAFFACDTDAGFPALDYAKGKFYFLSQDKLRCYVLLGYEGESLEAGVARLKRVWDIGMIPFAQLYQPPDKWIDYPHEWRDTARTWSRPAATKALMKGG